MDHQMILRDAPCPDANTTDLYAPVWRWRIAAFQLHDAGDHARANNIFKQIDGRVDCECVGGQNLTPPVSDALRGVQE